VQEMSKPKTPEHRAKIAESLRGRPKSAETRERMATSARVRGIQAALFRAASQHPELLQDPAEDSAGT